MTKQNEIQAVAARLQHTVDAHVAEKQGLTQQYQQVRQQSAVCVVLLFLLFRWTWICSVAYSVWSWGSVVSILTSLQAEWSEVQLPLGPREFSPKHFDQMWCPHSLLFSGYWGSVPWIKQLGHVEVYHSP